MHHQQSCQFFDKEKLTKNNNNNNLVHGWQDHEDNPDAYSEPCRISTMDLFIKKMHACT